MGGGGVTIFDGIVQRFHYFNDLINLCKVYEDLLLTRQ